MHFINLLILLFSVYTFAELPELVTKQSLENIRYISSDDKATYYQKRSGDLMLSANFKAITLLSGKAQSHYHVSSGPSEKLVVVEVISSFHSEQTPRKRNEIYASAMNSSELKFIDRGISPQAQLDGEWVSFYDPIEFLLRFQHFTLKEKGVQISLKPKNPYFVPQSSMLSEESFLYIDQNSQGLETLKLYNSISQKTEDIFKASSSAQKLSYCQGKNTLFLLRSAYFEGESVAYEYKIQNQQLILPGKEIYSSPLADIGHLVCQDEDFYFIKTVEFNPKTGFKKSDIAHFSNKEKKISVITKKGNYFQLFSMGNRILSEYQGKFVVLQGTSQLQKDSFETTKEPSP